MALPKQVQKQSEAVQELYKELNEPEENTVGETVVEEELPTADSVEETAAESSVEQSGDRQSGENWQQKYKTLQGMYNAEVPQLRQTIQELEGKVYQFENLLANINQQNQNQQAQQAQQLKLISDEEAEEYGETLDVMRKVSKEEFGNIGSEVNALKAQIAQLSQHTASQTQQLSSAVGQTQEELFWNRLNALVPNWQEINATDGFKAWLVEVDPLSGVSRQAYLDEAQSRLDVDKVAQFFTTWSSLNGEVSARPTTKSSELEMQVSPKKGRSSTSTPSGGSKQTWSQADIAKFYDDIRKGRFKGRDDERSQIERDIFAAQQEGRIVT